MHWEAHAAMIGDFELRVLCLGVLMRSLLLFRVHIWVPCTRNSQIERTTRRQHLDGRECFAYGLNQDWLPLLSSCIGCTQIFCFWAAE